MLNQSGFYSQFEGLITYDRVDNHFHGGRSATIKNSDWENYSYTVMLTLSTVTANICASLGHPNPQRLPFRLFASDAAVTLTYAIENGTKINGG